MRKRKSLTICPWPIGATVARYAVPGGQSFGGGIVDVIAGSITTTLEGVIQPNPVSGLVSEGCPLVEVSKSATRKSRVVYDDSIQLRARHIIPRKGGIAKQARSTGESDGIDVQRCDISPSKSVLHGGLLGGVAKDVLEPVWVKRPNDARQLEAKPRFLVVFVQDADLVADLGISKAGGRNEENGMRLQSGSRHIALSRAWAGVDNVEEDWDREVVDGSREWIRALV